MSAGKSAPPGTAALQRAFAAHLRDPASNPAPAGIEPRRLAVYRDLFFNNVANFLATFFPVLRGLYTDEAWCALARDFYARHAARSPYFLDIAREFLDFLDTARGEHPDDPPCLRELAHYEWLELALDVAEEDVPTTGIVPDGDLLAGIPVLNPLAVLAAYRWPVHRIAGGQPLPAPAETWLLVWRDRSDRVGFLELNAATARLYLLLRDTPGLTGRAAALAAAGVAEPAPDAVLAGAREILGRLRARDIVLGTRDPADSRPA